VASLFQLAGSYTAGSALPIASSGDPDIPALIDERVLLDKKHYDEVILTSDSFVSVGLGGLTNVHVLVLKVVANKVKLRLTSTLGSQQIIPVEEFLTQISLTVPYTAIDLQRDAGVVTKVQIFLGEKAS
jgi:hypothetical protein